MVAQILQILTEIDQDFPTPLSKRINLTEYAEKICRNAILFTAQSGSNIIGIVAIYCNDTDKSYAYIPIVGITKQYRNCGLANSLMKTAIEYVKKIGFKRIGIHTESHIALVLYQKLGFKIIESNERKYLELNIAQSEL